MEYVRINIYKEERDVKINNIINVLFRYSRMNFKYIMVLKQVKRRNEISYNFLKQKKYNNNT